MINIKIITYITVNIGVFVSYNYAASHLLSIQKILLTFKNKKYDIITIAVPI